MNTVNETGKAQILTQRSDWEALENFKKYNICVPN